MTRDWNAGGVRTQGAAVTLFSSGLNTREREKGGPKGWDPGGREFRRVPWSWTERAFGRATHGSYISSANAFHAAQDSRELRSARPAGEAEFPARRTPLPLHAAENPRPQVPPGREVLHRLLDLTSANSPASPQLGREDRLFLICQILKEFWLLLMLNIFSHFCLSRFFFCEFPVYILGPFFFNFLFFL